MAEPCKKYSGVATYAQFALCGMPAVGISVNIGGREANTAITHDLISSGVYERSVISDKARKPNGVVRSPFKSVR